MYFCHTKQLAVCNYCIGSLNVGVAPRVQHFSAFHYFIIFGTAFTRALYRAFNTGLELCEPFRDVARVPEEDACCPCTCKAAEVTISTENRYILRRNVRRRCILARSIRVKTVSGKRSV